jgi:RNA polymerase sigma-70 factor (ECF subfamily)
MVFYQIPAGSVLKDSQKKLPTKKRRLKLKLFTRFRRLIYTSACKAMLKKGDDRVLDTEKIVKKRLLANYDRFYRLAYSYTHNAADAEDVVQEGAFKAIRANAKLRKVEQVDTWLYRIMVNEAYALLRRQNKNLPLADVKEEGILDSYQDIDLITAIDSLPETEAAIIRLRFFEDLPLAQIAEILELPLSTVKSKLYRSLKALRIELGE